MLSELHASAKLFHLAFMLTNRMVALVTSTATQEDQLT
jgi:hypothetical protein